MEQLALFSGTAKAESGNASVGRSRLLSCLPKWQSNAFLEPLVCVQHAKSRMHLPSSGSSLAACSDRTGRTAGVRHGREGRDGLDGPDGRAGRIGRVGVALSSSPDRAYQTDRTDRTG